MGVLVGDPAVLTHISGERLICPVMLEGGPDITRIKNKRHYACAGMMHVLA